MLKGALAIMLAAAVAVGAYWSHFQAMCGALSYVGPEAWSPMLLMSAERIAGDLFPGFIVGALLGSRQVLAGVLVSAICSVTNDTFALHYCAREWPSAISMAVVVLQSSLYGAAGAALGHVTQQRFAGARHRPGA